MQPEVKASSLFSQLLHGLAWLAGLLVFLIPFLGYWKFNIGSMSFYLIQGDGYIVENALIALTLASLGAIVGGYWWRLICHISQSNGLAYSFFPAALIFIAWLGHAAICVHTPFYLLVATAFLTPLILCVCLTKKAGKITLSWTATKSWFAERTRFNVVFFTFLLVSLIVNNSLVLFTSELGLLQATSFCISRIFFYIALVGLLSLLIELLLRATPPLLRWITWSAYGLLPIVVCIDAYTTTLIGRPLHGYVNGFKELTFDIIRSNLAVAAEGTKWMGSMHSSWIVLAFTLLFLSSMGFAYLCWQASRKWERHFSLKALLIITLTGIGIATAEQGIGTLWKSVPERQQEYQLLAMQTGIFSPPKGVGTYDVTFRSNSALDLTPLKNKQPRPDIYFFMIETLRADVIKPEITPFLADFEKTSCQRFGSSWAASNATHLSWFSTFYSQAPVFWGNKVEALKEDKSLYGAPTLKWLKAQGYNLEVRAVCDLEYNDFGITNFGISEVGKPGHLADLIEHCYNGSLYDKAGNTSEREVFAIDRLKQAMAKNGEGSNFYFTALDTPHYGYYWHRDFTPPFDDYVEQATFQLNPSPELLQQYFHRYWNACAWIDHQMKEFVDHLKATGKYDNAIIIITGDHGEEFQEHGKWCHCSNLFKEQIQVPMLIKWPKSHSNQPAHEVASHLDIMPSIMAYIGASDKELSKLRGVNLLKPDTLQTSITTTNYAGTNGQTMKLKRGQFEAFFSWPRYWLGNLPDRFSLETITKDGKQIKLGTASENLELLKLHFPDAFERFFSDISVVE